MKLIDADALKKRHREDLTKNLIDKNRDIDLSEYVKESCDAYDKYINEMPTACDIDAIRNEIENLNCEYIDYNTGCGCSAYVSQNEVLQILNKYTKGVKYADIN